MAGGSRASSKGEQRGCGTHLRWLVACVVVCDADVDGAIVVDVVERQVSGFRPQRAVIGHRDGFLHPHTGYALISEHEELSNGKYVACCVASWLQPPQQVHP